MRKVESDLVKDIMEFLAGQDPEVGAAVQAEYDRQRRNIELIASENFVSPAVLAAAGVIAYRQLAKRSDAAEDAASSADAMGA